MTALYLLKQAPEETGTGQERNSNGDTARSKYVLPLSGEFLYNFIPAGSNGIIRICILLEKEDETMQKTMQRILSAAFIVLGTSPVYANEPGGGYEGITTMYYAMIGLVLAYGVWDIFFKKD